MFMKFLKVNRFKSILRNAYKKNNKKICFKSSLKVKNNESFPHVDGGGLFTNAKKICGNNYKLWLKDPAKKKGVTTEN